MLLLLFTVVPRFAQTHPHALPRSAQMEVMCCRVCLDHGIGRFLRVMQRSFSWLKVLCSARSCTFSRLHGYVLGSCPGLPRLLRLCPDTMEKSGDLFGTAGAQCHAFRAT